MSADVMTLADVARAEVDDAHRAVADAIGHLRRAAQWGANVETETEELDAMLTRLSTIMEDL